MKLWCLFLLLLLFTTLTTSWYLADYNDALLNSNTYEDPTNVSIFEDNRYRRSSVVKRSQRNANILYRYCRRNGHAPRFCLKYAVTMIFATGS